MAKYLITGVAGFIASRVAAMLLEEGHSVVGIDDLNHAYDVRMKEYRLAQLNKMNGFSFYKQDIADKDALSFLEDEISGSAAAVNLAARAGVRASVEDPWVYVNTNITGTLNVLELCKKLHIPKMILASTSSIYGQDAPLPTPEDSDTSHPLQPYAATKKGAEALAYAYHYLHDIDVSVVRYFTVYGPAGRPDMVMFRFAKWLIEDEELHVNGDGTQSRGFTYVDDIARGTIQALKPLGYQIINLGGHQTITLNELIAMMESITGKQARLEFHPFPKADMQANQADTGKARDLLGWQPQVPLKQGVKRLIDWYLENREWARDIDTG